MKVSTVLPLLLGALPLLVNGAAIVQKRKETQTEYDEETTSFRSQGLCRAYISTDQSLLTKGLSTCDDQCGDLAKQRTSEGKMTSVSCFSGGQGIPTYTDPDGNQFNMGECICDIPILDEIVNDVLMALPAIAEIGCEILFDSLDLVLQIGAAAIPGEGEVMDAGMAAAVKAAKTITENGQDASSFLQWFANPCGSSNYTQMIDNIFDPLSSVPDSVMPGLGCKKKPCPGKKTGDATVAKTTAAKTTANTDPTTTAKATTTSAAATSKAASTAAPATTSKATSAAPTKSSAAPASSKPAASSASPKASSAAPSSALPSTSAPSSSAPAPTASPSASSADDGGACSIGSANGKVKRVCTQGPASVITRPPSSYFSEIPSSVTRMNSANAPRYTGPVGAPNNKAQLPSKITCGASPAKTGQNGAVFSAQAAKEYSTDEVLYALQQGARYELSNPLLKSAFQGNKYPTNPAASNHQVAGKSSYPHDFANGASDPNAQFADKDTVNPVGDPACKAPNLREFPIMRSGQIYQGDVKGASAPNPDSDRVLFAVDPVTKSTVYCGMMTHAGKNGNYFNDCLVGGD